MAQPQQAATTITIGDQTFISHLYSSSQALELLLALGECIAGPLSRLLGREVSPDMQGLAGALDELRDQDVTTASLVGVFAAIRKVGGLELILLILQTTYYRDQSINTKARFDATFMGPAGVLVAAQLVWEVLRFQLGPLFSVLQSLLAGLPQQKGKS